MRRISSTSFLNWSSIFALLSSERLNHPAPTGSPCILSITMFVRLLFAKAQYTQGTGIEVCFATNIIVEASLRLTWHPYMIHTLSERNRMVPVRFQKRFSSLIVRSVK
jgi:hypothetical protein